MRENWRWQSAQMVVAVMMILWASFCISWADDTAEFELGNDLLREGRYEEALAAYDTFVKENTEHRLTPAAKWTMANIHLAIENDVEKATGLFREIVNENPGTEWEIYAYDRLSRCFEEQQEWEKAVEIYDTAIERLTASGERAASQERVDRLRRRLLSCYQNMNDHGRIVLLYQRVLAENPAAPSAAGDQFDLAQAYLDMNELQEAAHSFALVLERYPASEHAQRVYSDHRELVTSRLDYDWARFSTFQSAQRLGQAGQHDEALTALDEVIEAAPDAPMAHAARFHKHLIEYRRSGDVSSLREELASGRDDYPYGFGGVAVNPLNYFLEMVAEAQQTLASNVEEVGAYARMGMAYQQTQAYDAGVNAYRKAISIAPDSPNLYNMLGYCYLGLREHDEAISAFEKLIEVAPDDANSYDSMAEGHYIKGDTAAAIQYYEKSLATDSTFSNPCYMLGRIYGELGRRDRATEYLERYLELDPDGFWSRNAQNLLERLNSTPPNRDEPKE